MKKPVCFYSIADKNNIGYAKLMHNSLMKFHLDIPHFTFTEEDFGWMEDPQKFYRMYAIFGEKLSKEYELVIQIDADSIVCGSLDHIINDKDYEIGGVLNNNLVDPKFTVLMVPSQFYINAGFLAVRSERFWQWWARLNYTPYFEQFQFREQDTLNIIFHLGDLKGKIFDMSQNWHGLIHKGQWSKFEMKGEEIVLPATEGVCQEDKTIKIIHWAGGNIPKLNYRISFKPEVVKRLDYLVSEIHE